MTPTTTRTPSDLPFPLSFPSFSVHCGSVQGLSTWRAADLEGWIHLFSLPDGLAGDPPNLQSVTVGEEERGGRDPTSRRTPMRATPDCRPPLTARHASQPRSSSTSHPPQQQDTVHRELHPGTGKGARAGAGPLHATRPAAGPAPADARPATAAPHDTSPDNNNRPEEMRTSCRQQPAPPQRDAAKMSREGVCV
jgi:hypothetical protein